MNNFTRFAIPSFHFYYVPTQFQLIDQLGSIAQLLENYTTRLSLV